MNNKMIIGGVVAVVVLGALGWYMMGSGSAKSVIGNNPDKPSQISGAQKQTGTIATLIALGQSMKCDVTITDPKAPGTGTIYVSQGKMRGEFNVSSQGKALQAYMINDTQNIYTWTSIMPQGAKMPVSTASPSKGPSQGYNPETPVEYSCATWTTDEGIFTPPSNIQFMQLGAGGMPNIPTTR
jgi:hypothetical protein